MHHASEPLLDFSAERGGAVPGRGLGRTRVGPRGGGASLCGEQYSQTAVATHRGNCRMIMINRRVLMVLRVLVVRAGGACWWLGPGAPPPPPPRGAGTRAPPSVPSSASATGPVQCFARGGQVAFVCFAAHTTHARPMRAFSTCSEGNGIQNAARSVDTWLLDPAALLQAPGVHVPVQPI